MGASATLIRQTDTVVVWFPHATIEFRLGDGGRCHCSGGIDGDCGGSYLNRRRQGDGFSSGDSDPDNIGDNIIDNNISDIVLLLFDLQRRSDSQASKDEREDGGGAHFGLRGGVGFEETVGGKSLWLVEETRSRILLVLFVMFKDCFAFVEKVELVVVFELIQERDQQ